MQEYAALNQVYSYLGSPDIKEPFLVSRSWQESYIMDLFVCCSWRRPWEMQECAAMNYIYSCPVSPDIKEQFLESRSCKNHISWICQFLILRGRQKKCKSVKLWIMYIAVQKAQTIPGEQILARIIPHGFVCLLLGEEDRRNARVCSFELCI